MTMRRASFLSLSLFLFLFLSLALSLSLPLSATSPRRSDIQPNLLAGLKWRNVGPFRAGRVSAVSGAIGEPGVFYMGMVLGGVWKTTSAGATWYPIFDSVKEM